MWSLPPPSLAAKAVQRQFLRSDPPRFDLSCDRPYECRHLTCDSGGDHVLTFALCCKPAIPRAQSQLGIPRDLSDLHRQIGQPLHVELADPGALLIGPRPFDQYSACMRAAGLGDAAAGYPFAG